MRIIKAIRNFYTIRLVKPFRQIHKLGIEISSKLGDGWVNKKKIKVFSFLCFLQHRIRFPRNIKVSTRIKFLDKSFKIIVAHRADMWAIREVFFFKHYNVDISDPKIIFDLGSNVGMSVLYFKAKYPQAKIYSVEPNPYIFQRLKGNIPQDVLCLNLAVAGRDGKAKFYVSKNHSSSSLVKSTSKSVEVNCRTIDSLMEKYNISIKELPRMFKTDSAISSLDAKSGDVKYPAFPASVHDL